MAIKLKKNAAKKKKIGIQNRDAARTVEISRESSPAAEPAVEQLHEEPVRDSHVPSWLQKPTVAKRSSKSLLEQFMDVQKDLDAAESRCDEKPEGLFDDGPARPAERKVTFDDIDAVARTIVDGWRIPDRPKAKVARVRATNGAGIGYRPAKKKEYSEEWKK
ncbi:hypothetical protein J8273_7446 [Carpediemonas membranifera]|uniref:Uncharacterized protein n=1 Tax=Carpediemonas membranifera TaxID=201153 RepID=A0A8J6B1S5_9EUKA|nr:hypothetical protein J8273_7446 [Carpediemonas membranifera]|eukprot:KAG9391172.1 hypothetical protein J8273_7446 [Carpediemonas membranifera]